MSETTTPGAGYLDPHALAATKPLELRARMVVEGMMAGMHKSPAQGVSVEFAQHRQYAPGDDLRHLDWKVFGRTDKLYVKQQQRETNLDMWLLVDVSGSMGYGSVKLRSKSSSAWRKYDHAATIAAVLGYLALGQQDRVGLVLFDSTVNSATRLSNSHDHWKSIVDALESNSGQLLTGQGEPASQSEPTNIGRLIDQVLAKNMQRGLIVLISDLFDDIDAIERAMAKVYHSRNDMIVFQVLDPTELTFPFMETTEFVGLEGDGRLTASPAALRAMYLKALNDHQRAMSDIARRFRFGYRLLDTSDSVGPPLSQYLAFRASMIRRRTG